MRRALLAITIGLACCQPVEAGPFGIFGQNRDGASDDNRDVHIYSGRDVTYVRAVGLISVSINWQPRRNNSPSWRYRASWRRRY